MDMTAFLKEKSTLIDECDQRLIRRLIGKIMVHEDRLTVEFKSGWKLRWRCKEKL